MATKFAGDVYDYRCARIWKDLGSDVTLKTAALGLYWKLVNLLWSAFLYKAILGSKVSRRQRNFSTFSTAASFINCINWIFDKTLNVFYRRVPRIASNILRNLSHSWEFIFTCFQALRLLENLAFYTKHDFSAISCLHPTLSTVEWSLGYFLFISSDKYFFWIDQHAWNIMNFKASIPGPRNRGKFGDIHTYIHTYIQTYIFTNIREISKASGLWHRDPRLSRTQPEIVCFAAIN